jgi:predicted metal-dependent phosphoesterase TrpH
MSKKLKVDFHLHSKDDIKDRIPHSNETLIDEAARQGYDVISITNHDGVTYSPRLTDYAKERGILLIPGCEAKIQNKHVLLYNFDSICSSFDQVREKKDKNNLVIAPHPFYPARASLNGVLMRYLDAFDALEYCHYHHEWINFNKKAADLSQEKNIPMVGTSDTHQLFQLGLTYSLIEAEKDMIAVFEAIKQGKTEIFTRPLSFRQLINIRFGLQLRHIFRIQSPNSPQHGIRLPPPIKLQVG